MAAGDWLDVEWRTYEVVLNLGDRTEVFICKATLPTIAAAKATQCNPRWQVVRVQAI